MFDGQCLRFGVIEFYLSDFPLVVASVVEEYARSLAEKLFWSALDLSE